MCTTRLLTQLIFIVFLGLGALNTHLGCVVGCHEAEREALFKFKHSLLTIDYQPSPFCLERSNGCPLWEDLGCDKIASITFDKNVFSSWEGENCCSWKGVGCDNVTSNVNRLEIHNVKWDLFDYFDAPELDPSLLELRHLKYLDLSGNDFQGRQIPEFIGSFKHLRYLNLSNSNFGGVIPSQLGNLSELHDLDLFTRSTDEYPESLSTDLQWASKLVSLQYLNIGGVNISQTSNSMHVLSMLPSLLRLRLSDCRLATPDLSTLFSNSTLLSRIQQLDLSHNMLDLLRPPHAFPNMTSLTYLDLSSNNINSSIPLWMRDMGKLEHFDISHNSLKGQPLPTVFANLTSLRHLSLSSINLNGVIPLWVGNMRELEHLDLSQNSINHIEGGSIMGMLGNICKLKSFDLSFNYIDTGEVAHSNVSKCLANDLEIMRLKGNMIRGSLSPWFGNFRNLQVLDISQNKIDDIIPISIGSLSDLKELDLSDNSIKGIIPFSLGQCKALVFLDLSSNFLQGALSEIHLSNLSRLTYLDLSFNPELDLNLSSNWSPSFELIVLRMNSCQVQTQFPRWTGNQTKLKVLDLSDNIITGDLVEWFSSTQLVDINISHNQITGPVPYFSSSSLDEIDLSYNLLSGPILHDDPSAKDGSIVGVPVCQLPYLEFLDIQRNQLVGTIPDCWCLYGNHSYLIYINLSSNNLSGNIPKSMGELTDLTFLNLSNNSLRGAIPPPWSISKDLEILDLGENKLVGNIPINWEGPYLRMLRLRGNRLVGVIPSTLCSLPKLQLIDLAHNNLTGGIPACFGHLISMESPPLYHESDVSGWTPSTTVVLKGTPMSYRRTLKFVVNLDLSCNALVGTIPEEITNLSTLIGLNLSHNHLTGYIPENIGEMRSLESIDLSNNNLSGTIPSSISALTLLITLDLSYNNLRGQIPTGRQLQTLNSTFLYKGNPRLCGDPSPNKCTGSHGEKQMQQEREQDSEDRWEKPLFSFVIMSGLATGFWGVVGSLLLKRRFRFALFQLVDRITDYFYVQVMVWVNRLRN